MLKVYKLIQFTLLVCLTITSTGCGKKTAKPINPELLPAAFSQTLIVKNETEDEVDIFPAPGVTGEPLVLKPGESISINFMVNRKASVDESGNPTKDGWVVEIDKQHKFLGMKDTYGLLRVKTLNGELWEYKIDLGRCWFENKPPTKDHELTIREKGPDKSATAAVLCK